MRAFCQQRETSEHSFYQWRKRLAEQLPMKFALVETPVAHLSRGDRSTERTLRRSLFHTQSLIGSPDL